MKKHYLKLSVKLFLFLAVAIVSVNSAFAQTNRALEFKAPFDFYVANQKMPAGTYSVKSLSTGAILIRGVGEKAKSVIVPTRMAVAKDSRAEGGQLIFNRYENEYFLSQFFSQASGGQSLFESKIEREIQGKLVNVALNDEKKVEQVTLVAKGL